MTDTHQAGNQRPGLPPLDVPDASEVPALVDSVREAPEVDQALLGLLPLLGTWRGQGKGSRVDGPDFDFGQQMRFRHDGRAALFYESVIWDVTAPGKSVAREVGVWRPREDGVELLVSHDDGTAEISVGTVDGTRIELRSDVVASTDSAPGVAALHRLFGLVDGDLMYAWDRALSGSQEKPVPYMSARLRRVSDALRPEDVRPAAPG